MLTLADKGGRGGLSYADITDKNTENWAIQPKKPLFCPKLS